jgi:CRISPR/Cas system CMR subunit Cmr4 (Cas7 group RAMP superfamily)
MSFVGERRNEKMRKAATIVVDVSAGFVVTLTGLEILQFPLNVIWGIFNAWLWIASPALILWAKNKENASSF